MKRECLEGHWFEAIFYIKHDFHLRAYIKLIVFLLCCGAPNVAHKMIATLLPTLKTKCM